MVIIIFLPFSFIYIWSILDIWIFDPYWIFGWHPIILRFDCPHCQVVARSSLHINSESEVVDAVARLVGDGKTRNWWNCNGANVLGPMLISAWNSAVLRKVTAFLCPKYIMTQSNKRSKFLISNITRWARAECSRRGEESSARSCREKLHGVQYLIRCRSFSNIDLICTIVSIAQVKNLKLHWLIIILSPGQLWSALYLTL